MSSLRKIAIATSMALLSWAYTTPANAKSPIKSLNAPGCAWIGTRVVQSLVRDDIIAANDYHAMYKTMACPARQLILAFSCTVNEIDSATTESPKNTTPEASSAGQEEPLVDKANATTQIINKCWDDPTAKPAKPSLTKPSTKKS